MSVARFWTAGRLSWLRLLASDDGPPPTQRQRGTETLLAAKLGCFALLSLIVRTGCQAWRRPAFCLMRPNVGEVLTCSTQGKTLKSKHGRLGSK